MMLLCVEYSHPLLISLWQLTNVIVDQGTGIPERSFDAPPRQTRTKQFVLT